MARSQKRNIYIDSIIEMVLQGASRKEIHVYLIKNHAYQYGIKSLDKQIAHAKKHIGARLEKNADYFFALGQQRLEKITLLAFQSKNYRVALDATKTLLQLAGFMKGERGPQSGGRELYGGRSGEDVETTAEGISGWHQITFTEAVPPAGFIPVVTPEEKKDDQGN